jgi:hypothetical protein
MEKSNGTIDEDKIGYVRTSECDKCSEKYATRALHFTFVVLVFGTMYFVLFAIGELLAPNFGVL